MSCDAIRTRKSDNENRSDNENEYGEDGGQRVCARDGAKTATVESAEKDEGLGILGRLPGCDLHRHLQVGAIPPAVTPAANAVPPRRYPLNRGWSGSTGHVTTGSTRGA